MSIKRVKTISIFLLILFVIVFSLFSLQDNKESDNNYISFTYNGARTTIPSSTFISGLGTNYNVTAKCKNGTSVTNSSGKIRFSNVNPNDECYINFEDIN